MWTWSTGLGIAAASGHESAPIRWAWVSGVPAGLSQRRAGRHWVSGDPVAWSPANGAPGGAATREPAGGLGRATAGGRYLPRSRALGHRAIGPRGTRGDPAELPRPLAVGYGGITSGNFLAAGQTQTDKTQEQNKNFQKRKQNEVKGRRLLFRSGLLSRCTHEGGTGTHRQGRKLK